MTKKIIYPHIDRPWMQYYDSEKIKSEDPKTNLADYVKQKNLKNKNGISGTYYGSKTSYHDLFEKIVNEKKGGICYELNGLFLQLLKGIGYDAKYICAKIREEGTYFDHVLVMVTIENQEYICDVGFRDNFLYPIKIVPNIIQKNHNNDYKINKLDFNKYELIKINQNHAQRLYTFITEEKSLNDFSKRCKYYETTPDTYFTKSPFCALDTKKGKLFLTSDKFVISEDNNKKTIEITNKDEFNYYLEKYFDIII